MTTTFDFKLTHRSVALEGFLRWFFEQFPFVTEFDCRAAQDRTGFIITAWTGTRAHEEQVYVPGELAGRAAGEVMGILNRMPMLVAYRDRLAAEQALLDPHIVNL